MSMPTEYVDEVLLRIDSSHIQNLITQTDAQRVLQEVKERPENYPKFTDELGVKAIHIAYTLISCGCSLIENDQSETERALLLLEKAGKILTDALLYDPDKNEAQDHSLLIAGMSLYAAKQFSRAFITLKDIETDFIAGQIIISFIKKDFSSLIEHTNEAFFSSAPIQVDIRTFDEWVITHEIARCFVIVLDFIETGDDKGYTTIHNILEKILLLAVEDGLTLYWMILRLLKIILATFHDTSLWTIVPPLIPEHDLAEKYIWLLSNHKPAVTEIWPSQTIALPLATGENEGAVINLRTSAGKTRVAEITILKTFALYPDAKVLYLAPFRSLALELEQSLGKIFQPLGFNVSQLYGGATVNLADITLIHQAKIIIATPEKAKALIRSNTGIEKELKLIVIDEGHLFGPDERHIRNEAFLTHLKEFAKRQEIRVLLLSAVLPNSEDLAQWIANDSAKVAKSDWRPSLERFGFLFWNGKGVRLEWGKEGKPYNPNFIVPAPRGPGKKRLFPKDKNEAVSATAVRLSENGTVMIFSARANSIKGLANCVLLALGEDPEDHPWDNSAWRIFQNVCLEELQDNDIVLKAAQKGIICHNNDLPSLVRLAIERLMRSKPPRIIIASSTLGQGVNIGISTVIISTPYFYNNTVSHRDFWNICGRAGRAFSDMEGKILYAIDMTEERWRIDKNINLARSYFNYNQMEKAKSGVLFVLREIIEKAEISKVDFRLLIEIIANDFIDPNRIPPHFKEWLEKKFDLIDDELLAMNQKLGNPNNDVAWIDDAFRQSLAFIQATEAERIRFSTLLKERTSALLKQTPDSFDRENLIATGVPLSVSQRISDYADYFREIENSYFQDLLNGEERIDALCEAIRKIERWVLEHASNLLKFVPDLKKLDQLRKGWLTGIPYGLIARDFGKEDSLDKIVKEFYGFTLPWIIHALAQIFNPDKEQRIFQTFSNFALFVELGLPDETAANIYLSGVRSRSASLELAASQDFQGKNISETKKAILSSSQAQLQLSENTQEWISFLSENSLKKGQRTISFPAFRLELSQPVDKLYVYARQENYYLTSADGYFSEQVVSTDNLPFRTIANKKGFYFLLENEQWILHSNSPDIQIEIIQ